LQFDDFWKIDAEEMAVQREVAEEIALAVLHRNNKATRLDAAQSGGKTTAVPDEVTDEVGANSPGAEDEATFAAFENGQKNAEHSVDFARRAQDQPAAERVLDIPSVGLADAQNDALKLGKVVQASGSDFAKPCGGCVARSRRRPSTAAEVVTKSAVR
jgi:hypothetical protein